MIRCVRRRGLIKEGRPLGLDDYNGRAERLKLVCDHYLDLGLGLREAADEIVIWPCPSCGRASFVARFKEGVAGCTDQGCETPPSMNLIELIAYLDADVPENDAQSANARFSEVFETAVGRERERETQRRERTRRDRDERRLRKGLAQAGSDERGSSEEQLF